MKRNLGAIFATWLLLSVGAPDGAKPVESGDVIFLVPDGTPLHGIFE